MCNITSPESITIFVVRPEAFWEHVPLAVQTVRREPPLERRRQLRLTIARECPSRWCLSSRSRVMRRVGLRRQQTVEKGIANRIRHLRSQKKPSRSTEPYPRAVFARDAEKPRRCDAEDSAKEETLNTSNTINGKTDRRNVIFRRLPRGMTRSDSFCDGALGARRHCDALLLTQLAPSDYKGGRSGRSEEDKRNNNRSPWVQWCRHMRATCVQHT